MWPCCWTVTLWQLWKNDCCFATLNAASPGPFNKPLCGSCQLTPQKYKKKQTHFKFLKKKKSLWAACEFASCFFFHWSFLVCKVLQQWMHLTWNYCAHWQEGEVRFFKVACLYGWKTLNHVRMLAVHLAVAVRVLQWRHGIRPRTCHEPSPKLSLIPRPAANRPAISMPTHLIKNHPLRAREKFSQFLSSSLSFV